MATIHEFGTAPTQKRDGYGIEKLITCSETDALAMYEGQDVRLVRGPVCSDRPWAYEFAVMVRRPSADATVSATTATEPATHVPAETAAERPADSVAVYVAPNETELRLAASLCCYISDEAEHLSRREFLADLVGRIKMDLDSGDY